MTIDKLPSGSYRIRLTEKGRAYSLTVPYKPTQKQAFELIMDKINRKEDDFMLFSEASAEYLKVKSNVLSPSTLFNYGNLSKNTPEWFKNKNIYELSDYEMQKLVNEYSLNHAPRTTHTYYTFICAVIRLFIPSVVFSPTMPQNTPRKRYTPTRNDVINILEYAKPTKYFAAIYLASLSCRQSEICALTLDDLSGNQITINKAYVRADGGYVLKPTPKTDKSNRVITIPDDLREWINEKGYIFEGYPRTIDKFLTKAQDALNIPHFSIHLLRHYFASYAHDLGYSDAVIMSLGGWSSDSVMKSVYRHAMNEDEAKKSISNDFAIS